jgi:uncharacterized protein YggE
MEESKKQSIQLRLDLRIICVLLLLIIVALVGLWRPWSAPKTSDRTIQVTGEATVKAEPDEYVFSPAYEFSSPSKKKALADMTEKSNSIVAKLKTIGLVDSQIKTNATNYDMYAYNPVKSDDSQTYTLRLTITVGTKDLAQKTQDYLLTTTPSQNVTAVPGFSNEKQKSLESQARDEATKDARKKADQSATNLGFKVGSVKSVSDGSGFRTYPMAEVSVEGDTSANAKSSDSSLTIQPGENELNYSVTVVYYVR